MDAITSRATVEHNTDPRTRGALYRNGCLGCDANLRNPAHTLCAACAEDMGYARRAR